MGTVICHPSGSSDLVSPCYRCAGTCLPGFIIDARERHEGNQFRQLKSDSMYAMAMKQPKIVVTEGHLEYQMQNKKVASSPETKSGRAERAPSKERECSSTASLQPSCTNEQTSLPKNGKVSNEASLTIVRRSNSRKDNLIRTDPTDNVASCNSSDCQSQVPQSSEKFKYHECSNSSITADKKLNSENYSNFLKMQPIQNTISPDESMTTASSAGYDDVETIDLATENLPAVDTPDACDKAAMRLRCLLRLLQRGEISAEVLQKNLHYAARVLEAVFIDETNQDGVLKDRSNTFSNETTTNAGAARTTGVSTTQRSHSGQTGPMHFSKGALQRRRLRTPVWAKPMPKMRLADEDDELSEVQPDAVPPEVREWLASTFTRQLGTIRKRSDEKPKFRSVAHAIRAGIFVDRIYRRVSNTALMQFPADVVRVLKTLDEWSFDVFALAEAANGQPVKYLGYDLLNRYGMIHKFKVPPATLELFLNKIEEGYCRFRNPYHNNLHAADVAQSVHHVLCQTGLMNWMSDLEIFATLLAAIIHDYEHTGTTNNFHVMSGSETAIIYNDRAVLENHHISAAFRVLKDDDCNILSNLSREEYRELRSLVIDMVLATDMSYHFQQLKNMRSLLSLAEPSVDKSKALSLVLHCCDISHPAKNWSLHHRWTMLLLEEFFRQGDLERELGLPFSPLCDRNNTLVAESQIGFIEFIVEPSMAVCSDMLECILAPLAPVSCKNATAEENATPADSIPPHKSCETITEGIEMEKHGSSNDENKQPFRIRKPWVTCLSDNKKIWKEQAIKDAETVTVPSNSDEKDKEQVAPPTSEHKRESTD